MATLYERRASGPTPAEEGGNGSAILPEAQKPSPGLELEDMPSPTLHMPHSAPTSGSAVGILATPPNLLSESARNSPAPSSVPPRILMSRNDSSASSFSRNSSVRSTTSVQAVPMRTPARTPIHSPALSRNGSHIGYAAYVPELNGITASPPEHSPPLPLPSPIATHIESCPPVNSQEPINLDPSLLSDTPSAMNWSLPTTPTGSKSPPHRLLMPELLRTVSNQSVTQAQQRRSRSDFDNFQLLGQGSYSRVFAVTDKQPPHKRYALKVLEKRHIIKERKEKYVTIEKNTLNRLGRHPGIVRIYWTFHDEGHLYFVLELAEQGEILTFMRRFGSFDTDTARYYAAQIVSAVEHMHHKGVIHRDLKPENILLDSKMRIKITDFGTAKLLDLSDDSTEEDQRGNSFVGTAEYVSPEVLTSKTAFKSSDLWAIGVVLYQMLSGHHPFKGASEYLTFQKILKLDYAFPSEFPPDARHLVETLLRIDPQSRPSLQEIKGHPFFAGIDWTSVWVIEPPTMKTGLAPPRPAPQYGDTRWRQFEGLDYVTDDDDLNDEPSASGGVGYGSTSRGAWESDPADGDENGPPSPRHRSRLAGAEAADARMSTHAALDKWSTALHPGELVVFSSPVVDRSRGSLFSKRRLLILTDHGRLLSVKEHRKDVKVKSAIFLGRDDGENEALSTVEEDGTGGKLFRVVTSLRSYRYEDPSGSAARWISEIRDHHDAGLGKQGSIYSPG